MQQSNSFLFNNKFLNLIKICIAFTVVSSIGAIVVDGRVYPSASPSASNNTYNESQAEQKQPTNSTTAPTDGAVPIVVQQSLILPTMVAQQPANAQQNSYQQQVPLHVPPQQQPQHTQQSQNYMQQYPAPHNMPPRSSPQAHQPRVPYTVNYNSNRLQQPLMIHQQRPLGNCHQQQVTSSTHPHQQVQNVDQLGQNASLRGLLAHSTPLPPPPYPSFRPSTNHMSYRLPPGYRYSSNGTPQRGVVQVPPPHSYQSPNTSVMPGTTRLQQCSLTPPTTQHMGNYPVQHRWHIPQQGVNPCIPYTTSRHQQVAPSMPAPVNDTYKITLRNQQANNNQKYGAAASVSPCDNSSQLQNPSSAGHTVSSSVPKTPSPVTTPGKSDDTEKSLDKFCQKSLNDLMLTIAKLDSNGIVVIPEAQRNQMDSTQVDSSTDEDINSIAENPAGQSVLSVAFVIDK